MVWSFRSAAVFATKATELREKESNLRPLKLGKPIYKVQDSPQFRFWFSVPPKLDCWTLAPTSPYNEITFSFGTANLADSERITTEVIELLSRPAHAITYGELGLGADFKMGFSFNILSNQWLMYLKNDGSFASKDLELLLSPWASFGNAIITLTIESDKESINPGWSAKSLAERFTASEKSRIDMKLYSPELSRTLCAALRQYPTTGIDQAHVLVRCQRETFLETVGSLQTRLPGFSSTILYGAYREGFNPYERPAEADQGHVVRFPIFRKDVRGANVQIDVVHRPKGDCLFDIQVAHSGNPKLPPKVLDQLLAKIDLPFEIWSGNPLGRWEL